ncbi:hypothetical protein DXG01_011899 [Tephrocybe rancida]|nr:hypothetical protein DXG01_011899 [Tephrocybe rancida]
MAPLSSASPVTAVNARAMPKAASRPSFPTSSTDFALPPSSSVATGSSVTLDDSNLLLQRFRRPSLLAPKASYLSESRLHSPLASSFTLHSRRRSQSLMFIEEPESDKERMLTDSSGSSENPTPPLNSIETKHEDLKGKATGRLPLTPPRRRSSAAMDVQESFSPLPGRRLSFPVRSASSLRPSIQPTSVSQIKQPRILNLLAESRPEENEVKSEAAFQRLITSCSELPMPPRTPRVAADRGRYPEEAGSEELQREDTPSDDEQDHLEETTTPFAFSALAASAPIAIKKPHTHAGSVNGDDLGMSTSESSSFGTAAMDIDLVGRPPFDDSLLANLKQPPGSPMISSMSTPINHWRYTPPPTTSAVRSNKRKLDDRFDPYPTASKRRAVSPSMSYLRDNHTGVGTPMNGRNGRLPISIPVNIPGSAVNSAASSPTISSSYPTSLSRPSSRSSMSTPAKLTKKQKKGIAFRERKTGKGRSKDGAHHSEDNDLPVMEDQDAPLLEGASVEVEAVVAGKKPKPAPKVPGGDNQAKGKRKADAEDTDAGKPKKRKREDAVDVSDAEPTDDKPTAKRKKPVAGAGEPSQDKKVAAKPKADGKQRFILFVGNLKYTTSLDAITKHFAACDPPPTIRLLTPKSTAGKPTHKSKGCAFLEFTHRNALQQALKLHQSDLDGRMINVELTAGGGGKGEGRLEKVRERNKQLLGQRKEKIEKLVATDATAIPTMPDKPQRYSATSGIEQAPTTRRTWTVGDVDDGETHRGGRKHAKRPSKSKPSGKTWGTGVNAIPVG